MNDDEKFKWTKENTDLIEEPEAPSGLALPLELAKNFDVDPLQEKDSTVNYQRTQALAKYLFEQRAADLIVARGIKEPVAELPTVSARELAAHGQPTKVESRLVSRELAAERLPAVDRELWSDWKEASSTTNGKILQAATADELGGRLRSIDRQWAKDAADHDYPVIGGYEGIKAMMRAKWETSQYLLDAAGMHQLQLYRGLNLSPLKDFGPEKVFKEGYTQLPEMKLERNGAQSTSTDPNVSNKWDGNKDRVVIRGEVPRTAVLSVPAYGVNIKTEHEVVVAGTAWTGWDAWKGTAPEFESVPPHWWRRAA
jgi:hypothetical protein